MTILLILAALYAVVVVVALGCARAAGRPMPSPERGGEA